MWISLLWPFIKERTCWNFPVDREEGFLFSTPSALLLSWLTHHGELSPLSSCHPLSNNKTVATPTSPNNRPRQVSMLIWFKCASNPNQLAALLPKPSPGLRGKDAYSREPEHSQMWGLACLERLGCCKCYPGHSSGGCLCQFPDVCVVPVFFMFFKIVSLKYYIQKCAQIMCIGMFYIF